MMKLVSILLQIVLPLIIAIRYQNSLGPIGVVVFIIICYLTNFVIIFSEWLDRETSGKERELLSIRQITVTILIIMTVVLRFFGVSFESILYISPWLVAMQIITSWMHKSSRKVPA